MVKFLVILLCATISLNAQAGGSDQPSLISLQISMMEGSSVLKTFRVVVPENYQTHMGDEVEQNYDPHGCKNSTKFDNAVTTYKTGMGVSVTPSTEDGHILLDINATYREQLPDDECNVQDIYAAVSRFGGMVKLNNGQTLVLPIRGNSDGVDNPSRYSLKVTAFKG